MFYILIAKNLTKISVILTIEKKSIKKYYIHNIPIPLQHYFHNIKFIQKMKNLLLLFALPLFVFSCKSGMEAHKAAITDLDANWTAASASVADFANNLTKDITSQTEAASSLMLEESAVAALKPDMAAKWNEATTAFKSATAAYQPVQAELTDFTNMWTEKAAEVTALKDALTSGKYEGDAVAKIAELSGLVTQANEKVAAWTAKQGELKGGVDSALGMLKTAYEMVAPKK